MAHRAVPVLALMISGILAETLDPQYRAQVEQWRQKREAALKADWGWLTVSGLFWLKDGANTIGSDAANDVVLPASAPARLGKIEIASGQATFTASAPPVTFNGKPVSKTEMIPDSLDVLAVGSLRLLLIQRGPRLGIRLKDNNSKARRQFTHLSWYPIDESWKITAKFIPAPSATKMVFDSVIGEKETMDSPGYAEFEHGGKTYRLQAASEGDMLFFVIRDQTSGKATYPASRFLYAAPPRDGVVILDFNKAENPPCAFTDYATCPLPPPQNRLPLAITAGELKYAGSAH